MTVNKIFKFLWKDGKPLNYNRLKEKWPRTQTLEPIYEINSGAFIASPRVYKDKCDRIGDNPLLYELDEKKAFDIDWESDFIIAEKLWNNE